MADTEAQAAAQELRKRTDTAPAGVSRSSSADEGALEDMLSSYPEDEIDDSDTEEEIPAAPAISEGIPPSSVSEPIAQSNAAPTDRLASLDFRCLPPTKWEVEHVVAWVEFSFIWAKNNPGAAGVATAIRAAGLDGAKLMRCGDAELARYGVGCNADEREEICALRDDPWTWVRLCEPHHLYNAQLLCRLQLSVCRFCVCVCVCVCVSVCCTSGL